MSHTTRYQWPRHKNEMPS